jgi:hypothetical protein
MNAEDFKREVRNAREAFQMDAGLGRDDQAAMNFAIRDAKGLDRDEPRPNKIVAEHPLIYRIREMMGKADPDAVRVRKEMGAGRIEGVGGNIGHIGGSIASDIAQDRSRAIWWLLNAAQASGNVINEAAMGFANKDLFGKTETDVLFNDSGKMEAAGLGKRDQSGVVRPLPLIGKGPNGKATRKNYASGMVTALGIAPGIAINQGLGLLTPFGGAEGYEAVVPNAEDPRKTDNMLGEIASKYILGRTGNLLDYDDFKKDRPDVSKGEYNAYKAFKYDKALDLNPFDDGKTNLPGAIIKTTNDGIHGAEVQFLGRSLPVNTAIMPFATAVAGTALGVRRGKRYRQGGDLANEAYDPDAVKRGIAGGLAGYAGGTIAGNLLEAERRRRNQAENEAYYDGLDKISKEPGIQ